MGTVQDMLDSVRKKLTPSPGVNSEVSEFLKLINGLISKSRIDAKAVSGGSISKGTHLKDDFDIDIFVKFNYSKYGSADLSGILEKILKPLKPSRIHGSRDYFHVYIHKFKFEIVPVLNVSKPEKAVN